MPISTTEVANSNYRVRVGIVGGGRGFIGGAHKVAIGMGNRELVAGALHQNPTIAESEAKVWGLKRGYPNYEQMIREEALLPAEQKIQYLTIVTPNVTHFGIAKMALENGIPVFCEKPLTFDLAQAIALQRLAKEKNLPFGVAYTYTGFWATMKARDLVMSGALGNITSADSWYNQGWLDKALESAEMANVGGHQQAEWRTDPARAGISCCGGDIGTHAFQNIRFITGLEALSVYGFLRKVVPGRKLDDEFLAVANLSNGVQATVRASQIRSGKQNDVGFMISGTKGTLTWDMQSFTELSLEGQGPKQIFRQGDEVSAAQAPFVGLPGAHWHAHYDAFAALHTTMEARVRALNGEAASIYPHPTVADGVAGMAFIKATVESNERGHIVAPVEQNPTN
ncbi:MAG: Gfo/Idh/MocA family oxidoreductase [Candidatus Saganbacteria bacterium]|nr:Gfo/Idh/MocA family oxidoreductase [Candidatus Saganbacteria bacterium]